MRLGIEAKNSVIYYEGNFFEIVRHVEILYQSFATFNALDTIIFGSLKYVTFRHVLIWRY